MSLKHSQLKKTYKGLLSNCYIEQIHYLLKTQEICPYDVDYRGIQTEISKQKPEQQKKKVTSAERRKTSQEKLIERQVAVE